MVMDGKGMVVDGKGWSSPQHTPNLLSGMDLNVTTAAADGQQPVNGVFWTGGGEQGGGGGGEREDLNDFVVVG